MSKDVCINVIMEGGCIFEGSGSLGYGTSLFSLSTYK